MVVILNANCLDAMKEMDDNSVHSIVTDPPYGLSFMGKKWDYDVPSKEIWVEALRVLKPGGYLLSFAGSRTYHRMAVAIEDAGFEIRDQIMWIYGSGFPKSLNISKAIDKHLGAERKKVRKPYSAQQLMMKDGQNERPFQNKARELGYHETAGDEPATPEAAKWDGWGTALKPAHETIVVARKPPIGTIAENVLEHGTGGINIDESRVGDLVQDTSKNGRDPAVHKTTVFQSGLGNDIDGKITVGRFPANVIHDGSEEVKQLMPNTKGGGNNHELGDHGICFQEGKRSDKPMAPGYDDEGSAARYFKETAFSKQEGRFPANVIHDGSEEVLEGFPHTTSGEPGIKHGGNTGAAYNAESRPPGTPMSGYGDSGSAARFFYCAKASTAERNAGIVDAKGSVGAKGGGLRRVCEFCGAQQMSPEDCKCEVKSWVNPLKKNFHPTVKPIALMEYLCRLVTPPGGTVLDPFMGSGTTGIAALRLGFDFIGVEMSEEYIEIASARIAHWVDAELTFDDGEIVLKKKPQAEWL